MAETHPCVRYIARIHGYYPTDPLDAFWCDRWSLYHDPILARIFAWFLHKSFTGVVSL